MDKSHRNHAQKPRTQLRRKEYQVIDEIWIKELLRQSSFGTLATEHEDQPFITPLIFKYLEEDQAFYIHGAKAGRLRSNLNFNSKIAFNVVEFGKILAHQNASEFNLAYKSVTLFGTAHRVEDDSKATSILNQLLKKYAPQLEAGKDFHHIQPGELKKTAVYQIEIEEWSGKHLIETSEYLDSFEYTPTRHPKDLT